VDRNMTILVVEDNHADGFFLERAIRKLGLKNPVRILTDGGTAIAYLKGEGEFHDRREFPSPSVLFLDISIPRVNGFELLGWLRDHPQCRIMPIMVFSGSENPEDVERAYLLGANAYLVKPNTSEELVELLRSAYDFWSRCAKPRLPATCV
jgi:CheY-like chemotaxis protein